MSSPISNDTGLRDAIARAIFDDDKNFDAMPREYHEKSLFKAANRILAIPEIAEALKAYQFATAAMEATGGGVEPYDQNRKAKMLGHSISANPPR